MSQSQTDMISTLRQPPSGRQKHDYREAPGRRLDTEFRQRFRFVDNITRSINGVQNEYKSRSAFQDTGNAAGKARSACGMKRACKGGQLLRACC
jgi:hypothetical protein